MAETQAPTPDDPAELMARMASAAAGIAAERDALLATVERVRAIADEATDDLLTIAAFGFHESHREELRAKARQMRRTLAALDGTETKEKTDG